jgi:hypothetical protein
MASTANAGTHRNEAPIVRSESATKKEACYRERQRLDDPRHRLESTTRERFFDAGSTVGMARNVLFCSLDSALCGDFAWQVGGKGHDVNYHVEHESDCDIADGFVAEPEVHRGY